MDPARYHWEEVDWAPLGERRLHWWQPQLQVYASFRYRRDFADCAKVPEGARAALESGRSMTEAEVQACPGCDLSMGPSVPEMHLRLPAESCHTESAGGPGGAGCRPRPSRGHQ